MFGRAGHAYVYFIYGMYQMFNVVAGKSGCAHAVLIRAAEPLDHWQADLSGPGKLTRAFQITAAHNRIDLTQDTLFFMDNPNHQPRIIKTPRIGIDYAKHWKDKPLRFIDADSNAVSKRIKTR